MHKAKILTLIILCGLTLGCQDPTANLIKPRETTKEEKLEQLASCLTEKGASLYVSTTCPHCKKQKELFGESVESLRYYDCQENQEKCSQAKVQAVPTWIFADGSRLQGTQSLQELSEKTNCQYN